MQTCPKCHQQISNDYCPSCAEKERAADRHDNLGNWAGEPKTSLPSQSPSPSPAPSAQPVRRSAPKRPPLPLDNFAARFIYARITPFLLMLLLAFEIVSSLKFLQNYRDYYGLGLFTMPFPKLYVPLLVLLLVNLLMMFKFREFHQAKSRERAHPTFCLFVFFWFWYMRSFGLAIGFWLINHF